MEQRKAKFPAGVSTALMPNEETMSSYMGLTREQKREILTHALIGEPEQSALLRSEIDILKPDEESDRLR